MLLFVWLLLLIWLENSGSFGHCRWNLTFCLRNVSVRVRNWLSAAAFPLKASASEP